MEKIIKGISLLLLFTIWNTALNGQSISKDSVDNLLPSNFSGQVVIKKTDAFLYRESYGYRDLDSKLLKINDSTLFNSGEIAHTLIHYFIQHLAGLRQLKVTDAVVKYLPDFPYPEIQIQHLINHQSGLPKNYIKLYHRVIYNDFNIKLADKSIRFDNEDILNALIKKQPKLLFTPGDSTQYSNLNYLLLVSLIEKITFTPFSDFVERLFKHHNFVFSPTVSNHSDTLFNKAYGYALNAHNYPVLNENLRTIGFDYNDGTNGNQHIYFNATELALWTQFLFTSIDADYLLNNPNKMIMGGLKANNSFKVIQKTGVFGGTTSTITYFPKTNLIAVIQSNNSSKLEEYNNLIRYLKTID